VSHPHDELTAFLDHTLPPDRVRSVARHLAACPGCRAELERLRAAVEALAALPPAPEPSPLFAARLEAKLARARDGRAGTAAQVRRWRAWFAVPATAVAAAAVVAAVGVRVHRQREHELAARIELLEDYEVVASLGDVDGPEDAEVVAHLGELSAREGPP
jgi:anti-sigma factor RsiW